MDKLCILCLRRRSPFILCNLVLVLIPLSPQKMLLFDNFQKVLGEHFKCSVFLQD